MFCEHCGKEFTENVKFCTNCGVKLQEVPIIYNLTKTNENSVFLKKERLLSPIYILIERFKKLDKTKRIIVVIALAFMIGMVFLVSGNHNSVVGEWDFVSYETKSGEYYDSPEMRYKDTLANIQLKKDGTYVAVYYRYNDYAFDKWYDDKIRGEYEVEDGELRLTYGYDEQEEFTFERKGKKLYLEMDSGIYIYEKK